MAAVYLGCPLWAHAPWRGRFFTEDASREAFLPQYASVFGTTEGNATFYGLPSRETVARWCAEAPRPFRFCFKFPRAVSHDRELVGAEVETAEFFERLGPLGERLGPFFLQLPECFGPDRLPQLATYLRALPRDHRYAVEVRSRAFFDHADAEQRLNEMLVAQGINRVIFDTRGLFASAADDPATREARRKKPRLPVRPIATGNEPFVRFVGDPDLEQNEAALQTWARVARKWMEQGRTPYFFLHHPDDLHAPPLARRLHLWLHREAPALVEAPPLWPVERQPRSPQQLDLFG